MEKADLLILAFMVASFALVSRVFTPLDGVLVAGVGGCFVAMLVRYRRIYLPERLA
jgi:uncharacterized membrane protein